VVIKIIASALFYFNARGCAQVQNFTRGRKNIVKQYANVVKQITFIQSLIFAARIH
jgi:hypothetical protein